MATKQKKARTDGRGTVRVSMHLEGPDGARIRGNISKTFKVGGASVGAVADALARVFVKQEAYTLKQ